MFSDTVDTTTMSILQSTEGELLLKLISSWIPEQQENITNVKEITARLDEIAIVKEKVLFVKSIKVRWY